MQNFSSISILAKYLYIVYY